MFLFMIIGVDGCPPIGQANGGRTAIHLGFRTVFGNAIVVGKKKPCSYSSAVIVTYTLTRRNRLTYRPEAVDRTVSMLPAPRSAAPGRASVIWLFAITTAPFTST